MRIPVSKPDITEKEIDAVVDVMKSNILSIGPKIKEFEKKMANYVGVKHAVGVNSGTSGLHLLVKAMGIKSADEVITTPFSFVASTNCFLFEGATPVFVDIDPKTLNIDISKIEEKITDKTKMILPVDIFGQPINMEEINKLAEKYNLKVIEDSCEALGSEYDGIKAGTNADGGIFAFYANKQITTAEGGMIITNDDEIAETCRSLRSQGRAVTGDWLHHRQLGYNYRLSELHSTIGSVQLDRIEEILLKRKNVANLYNKRLKDIKGLSIPFIDKRVNKMGWFVYVVVFDQEIDRDKIMETLDKEGISSKPYFTPIHLQKYMKEKFGFKKGDFPITERISNSSLALPFYTSISEKDVNRVCDTLIDILKR